MKKTILSLVLTCLLSFHSGYAGITEKPNAEHMDAFQKEMKSYGKLKALDTHVKRAFEPVKEAFDEGVNRRELNKQVATLKETTLSFETLQNFPTSVLQQANDSFWHLWTRERTPGITTQSEVSLCMEEIRHALSQSNPNTDAYKNDAHFLITLEMFQGYMDAFAERYHRGDFIFVDYVGNIYWVGACDEKKGSQNLLLEGYPWRNSPDAKKKSHTQKRCFLDEIGFSFLHLRNLDEMAKRGYHETYLTPLTQEDWDHYIDEYAEKIFESYSYRRDNSIKKMKTTLYTGLQQGDSEYSEYRENFKFSLTDTITTLDRVLPIYVRSPSDYGDATLKILFDKLLVRRNQNRVEINPFWQSLLTENLSIKQAIDLYAIPVHKTQEAHRAAAITQFLERKVDEIYGIIDRGENLDPILEIYGIHFTPIPLLSYPA